MSCKSTSHSPCAELLIIWVFLQGVELQMVPIHLALNRTFSALILLSSLAHTKLSSHQQLTSVNLDLLCAVSTMAAQTP
eukprot:scaffold115349_cov19-Tisochrysis_lutea.AAC.1